MFRSHRWLFAGRLVVGFEELPVLSGRSGVETNLGDVAPSRQFDRRPNSAVKVNLVVLEGVARSEFVGLVNTKPEGNVNRPLGVSGEGSIKVDREAWC